jgi:thiamine-monophosphate kinase
MITATRPVEPPDAGEFGLIARHFLRPGLAKPSQVALGIGDDCALLTPTPGWQLAISSDMLVQGRHFFPDVDPASLGHKALAVNLSDLAAMGARPLGFTLALALPEANDSWLKSFAAGLFALADVHACPLVGGDTTRGPLNICITVFGEVLPGMALRRGAGQVGDDVYVSGALGEARLALEIRQQTPWALAHTAEHAWPALIERMDRPAPRLALGMALSACAHAALDISDGLIGDLQHILRASGVGAEIEWASLPRTSAIATLPEPHQQTCLLHGGDDYELLFTAPAAARASVQTAALRSETAVHRIGRITAEAGSLHVLSPTGQTMPIAGQSFDHFSP